MGGVSVKKLYSGGMKVTKSSPKKPAPMKTNAQQPQGKKIISKGKH